LFFSFHRGIIGFKIGLYFFLSTKHLEQTAIAAPIDKKKYNPILKPMIPR
jgi:hypothetical protein